ncbi:MAG: MarR family winged helix-turn-helix transcriptional regulator [Roseiflexus sp.]|nr:MarR family winged helix-turn-helix transcriptional regulator [Roseiflexus sp.]MCS7287642.1 MarR family winged helix-turn-helix transcriptional regulator [Roseiflexus sp.]MDW8147838.1 MarR family winged helix-turn-helix transcriptional regulator [Roseiflexaceae bacterium]MDW8233727.1 MarR family winged helix-turn-helix transcriptional regulator [Roseiflexaceae bacterium]
MSPFDPKHRTTVGGQITIALYRIAQAIDYLLRERGKTMRLSPAQIQALLFLRYARPGVRTIGGLAQRLGVTYATASGVADALESKQFVARAPLPDDQRVVTLSLTSAGEMQADRLENILDEIEAVVNGLPAAEQSALLRGMQAIIARLQQSGYVRVYEMCWGCQFFRRNAHPDDPRGPHHCAFVDAPLAEPVTYFECPDFVPLVENREVEP